MKVCSIFSQVLKLFSRRGFEKEAKQHKAERHAGFHQLGTIRGDVVLPGEPSSAAVPACALSLETAKLEHFQPSDMSTPSALPSKTALSIRTRGGWSLSLMHAHYEWLTPGFPTRTGQIFKTQC